jgi:predicted Fe-Mo cluster-binding NifX family protein
MERKGGGMQVALTVWEGRISPLFDSTRMLLLADVRGRSIMDRHYEPMECDGAFLRAAKLAELNVKVLICGGISNAFAEPIEARGIKLIPFSSGEVEAVLNAYVKNRLHEENYHIP